VSKGSERGRSSRRSRRAQRLSAVCPRSSQSNADPRAEEPRPYHEAPADWPRPLLPNPLDVLPRRPAAIFRLFVLCVPPAMPIQLPLPYAPPAAFPLLYVTCRLDAPLPPRSTLEPPSSWRRLPTPHVHTLSYPHCYANGQLAEALKSRIVPSFQTPRYVDKCTQPANTKHHVMRVYGLFIKGPNT
jgi:hypothetical protein